jgi:hypothetical protein
MINGVKKVTMTGSLWTCEILKLKYKKAAHSENKMMTVKEI